MRTILLLLFAGLLSLTAGMQVSAASDTEEWLWAGYYPWVWSANTNEWLYLQPAGSQGFYAWNNAAEVHTIGRVPEIEEERQTKLLILETNDAEIIIPESILVRKSDLAEIRFQLNETVSVDCAWSVAKVSPVGRLYVFRAVETGACYTLYLEYTTDRSGNFTFNEPPVAGAASNIGTPMSYGHFKDLMSFSPPPPPDFTPAPPPDFPLSGQ